MNGVESENISILLRSMLIYFADNNQKVEISAIIKSCVAKYKSNMASAKYIPFIPVTS